MSESDRPRYVPSEEQIELIQAKTGLRRSSILKMPELRLARVLRKLRIPDRPRARIQHERGSLLNDAGR